MKTFLKENLALAAGVTLPLVLVLIFFVAGQVSKTTAPPMKYDLIFATDYTPHYAYQSHKIMVEDEKLVIKYTPPKDEDDNRYRRTPKLYKFDHETHYASLIDIDWDNVEDGYVKDPDLDALNQKQIIKSQESPDGYTLEYHYSHGSGILGELFTYRHRRTRYAVKNGAFAIPLNGAESFYNAQFIAWTGNE